MRDWQDSSTTSSDMRFDAIVETVLANKAGFFFVSGYGGTGKTFLWNTIITYL
jgi:Tfp pilus assembly pilus retraction ATPase PilT